MTRIADVFDIDLDEQTCGSCCGCDSACMN